jgi:ABC-type dipeptide/oligopeptide/nickel transport system permease component
MSAATASNIPAGRIGAPLLEIRDLHVTYATGEGDLAAVRGVDLTVETVFSIPGLGLLTTEAIQVPDFWVLQGTFLIAATGVILANLAANLVYGWLDPRVRT